MAELDDIIKNEDNPANEDNAGNAAIKGAGMNPEDTPKAANPWESIAGEQKRTIDALTEQINSLNAQIARLVQSGAQISDGRQSQQLPPMQQTYAPPALPDDYVPLRDLGKEIGKSK